MGRRTAAQQLEKVDPLMRVILGDLLDNAKRINEWWDEASLAIQSDPERALELLTDAEVNLENHVRIERVDALKEIRALTKRLGRELDETGETST